MLDGDQTELLLYTFRSTRCWTSGWNYTSILQVMYIFLFGLNQVLLRIFLVRFLSSNDGITQYNYPFETGSLTADTWTKITKPIPGNSNVTI